MDADTVPSSVLHAPELEDPRARGGELEHLLVGDPVDLAGLGVGPRVGREHAVDVGALRFETDDAIAKLSLVGAGIKSNPGVAADMFDALAAEGINIEMISTSSIRISCVIRAEDGERAVRAVHRRFGLDGATLDEEA